MFKFIHAADVHLDSPLRGLSRYESAPIDTIRNACRRAFENLIQLAIDENVAFVLLCGDLYDGDWKDYSTGIFFSQQMGKLNAHGIRVFAISGNHDAANKMTRSLRLPSNVVFLSDKNPQSIFIDEFQVALHGQSFSTQHVKENLAATFPTGKKEYFNIGMLHTSLDGREGHASYAPCSLDELKNKNYQYWALGHVHQHEILSKDPWVVFPGCIQGRHIRENSPKGCMLVEVDDSIVKKAKHQILDVFRWSLCKVDVDDIEEEEDFFECCRTRLIEISSQLEGKPFALRLMIEGHTKLASTFASNPERIESEIRAIAAGLANEDLWIEKIVNKTTSKRELADILSKGDTLAFLLGDIVSERNDVSELDGLKDLLSELKEKLPSDVISNVEVFDAANSDRLLQLINESKEMIMSRLLNVGGE